MMKNDPNIPTVLLVDDEDDIREVLGIFIDELGYKTICAGSGPEALELVREKRPPIMLCDIKMPDMDGISLLKNVKLDNPDTEVIMITGHADLDLAIQSLKHDATDFVTKPINEDVLEISLKRAFERFTMRRDLRAYTENLEQLVAEKTMRLIEAERMAAIGETIAGLSHSIKNIAGGLKGGIYVLGEGIKKDNKEYMEQGWRMVESNVEKIRVLSTSLIRYGRDVDMELKPMDPAWPVTETVSLLNEKAKDLGIEIVFTRGESLSEIVCDRDALYGSILNLVTNAIDALAADEDNNNKKITIETKPLDKDGIVYRIADNGIGMTDQVKENLFNRFFSTKGAMGAGIGLMTTKKMIEKLGGELTVESHEGMGAVFTINLPKPKAVR